MSLGGKDKSESTKLYSHHVRLPCLQFSSNTINLLDVMKVIVILRVFVNRMVMLHLIIFYFYMVLMLMVFFLNVSFSPDAE